MRRDITLETKERLIPIYAQVESDFRKFPNIKTTEDFFIWRDSIKNEIEMKLIQSKRTLDDKTKKILRNQKVEETIKGNDSLEMLYAWTKCDRMITGTKALIRTVNDQYGIEDNDHVIKATNVLHKYLIEHGKANTSDLFDILQIEELNLLVKYPSSQRTINTPYEFERAIVKEDEGEAWSAPLFVTLLKAYGVDKEDLLAIGREVITLGKEYINSIKEKNNDVSSKGYTYIKRG